MAKDNPIRNWSEQMDRVGWNPGPDQMVYVDNSGESPMDSRDYIMICETCGVMLNRFTGPHGEQWLHTAGWKKYDHDPIPKQVSRDHPRPTLCDFCGIEGVNLWAYKGDRVRQVSGNTGQDYGTVWAACAVCAPYVDEKDVAGIVERVMQVGPVASKSKERHRELMRENLWQLLEPYINSITGKEYVGPPIVASKLNPRMMPKIKDGLIRYWMHPTLYRRLAAKRHMLMSVPARHADSDDEAFRTVYPQGVELPNDVFERHRNHIVSGLEVADLYWASADFTHLAMVAGHDLTDISIRREELPSSFGLIVWDAPIGEITRPFGTAAIRAVSWTLVPHGVWINVYIQTEDGDPEITDLAAMRAEYGYLLAPNVGAGLPFDVSMSSNEDDPQPGENFVLTLLATWFLMAQPGVTEERPAPVDKGLIRAYKRSGRRPPEVRVVDLRRHAHTGAEPVESDAERRKISVRFMVRGHWKRQAYGPKRGLRRTIYVAPFMKGPDNAPLKTNIPTVKVLR